MRKSSACWVLLVILSSFLLLIIGCGGGRSSDTGDNFPVPISTPSFVSQTQGSATPVPIGVSRGTLSPALSPDGNRIAYVVEHLSYSNAKYVEGIYVSNTDGTSPVLIAQPEYCNNPKYLNLSWSPKGDKIIFSEFNPINYYAESEINATNTASYIINADGTDRKLIQNRGKWSSDGRKIYFSTMNYFSLDTLNYVIIDELNLLDIETNTVQKIISDENVGKEKISEGTLIRSGYLPSPDGKKVLFNAYPAHVLGTTLDHPLVTLYSMNVDGSEQKKIASLGYFGKHYAWSSDGSKIAFERDEEMYTRSINLINSDGTNLQKLVSEGKNILSNNSFSPDGKEIVFMVQKSDDSVVVYAVNSESASQRVITKNGRWNSGEFTFSWSLAGKKLAFEENTPSTAHTPWSTVTVADRDGSPLVKL